MVIRDLPPPRPPQQLVPTEVSAQTVETTSPQAVAAASAAVSAAVAGAIAGAVAVAVAGAVAGSVGGSVGGAAGGGAGGGAGGAGGAALPLVMGAQRLSLSSDLPVPQGEMDSGVAGGMTWASGDFGFFGSAPEPAPPPPALPPNGSRRLSKAGSGDKQTASNEPPPVQPIPLAYFTLMNVAGTFGTAFGVVAALQLSVYLFWRWRANRNFYESVQKRRSCGTSSNVQDMIDSSSFKFKIFPGMSIVCGLTWIL